MGWQGCASGVPIVRVALCKRPPISYAYFATVYSSNYELIFTFPNVKPKATGEIDQQTIYVKWFLDKTQNAWNTLHILVSIAV